MDKFFAAYWPQANEEIFGWREQGRWQKEHFCLWAAEDGEIVGAALFWKLGGVGYLRQLLVAPDRRGEGVGRRLMAAFADACRGCHKLALKTYKDSPSQRFYQGLGYQVEAVVEQDVHGIDWVYMRKDGVE